MLPLKAFNPKATGVFADIATEGGWRSALGVNGFPFSSSKLKNAADVLKQGSSKRIEENSVWAEVVKASVPPVPPVSPDPCLPPVPDPVPSSCWARVPETPLPLC